MSTEESMGTKVISMSIIVPVYKAEPYIEKCITSILDNRLFDSHCELIVVDDGSPDRSMEIVKRMCARRQNVTLVRQNNQGASMARNTGESRASGEYLWFVDNDDWLTAGAIEKILALTAATNADIVNIDHMLADGHHSTVKNRAETGIVYLGLEYLKLSCVQNPVWNYIYRTDYYRDCGLHFDKDIIHEDTLFTPIAMFLAERVVWLAEVCYVHNIREGSIMTSTNNLVHALDMLKVLKKLEAYRSQFATTVPKSRILSWYSALAVGGVFHYWKLLSKKERRMLSMEMDARLMLRPIFRSGSLKYLVAVASMLWHKPLPRGVQ